MSTSPGAQPARRRSSGSARAEVAPLAPNAWLRWDVVRRLLPEHAGTVLEIGCGQGAFGSRLADRYPAYLGLEPDSGSFAAACGRLAACPGAEVRNTTVESLPADATFDLVCAFEVIEHIEDDAAALASWAGRVAPGGHLLLSTPAGPHRLGHWDEAVGHYRRYAGPALAALVRAAGLVDVRVVQFGMPLGYLLEAGRNAVATRGMSRSAEPASYAEKTSRSGRLLQPNSLVQGNVTAVGTWPFRMMQRAFPGHGTGLVARGRRAATD